MNLIIDLSIDVTASSPDAGTKGAPVASTRSTMHGTRQSHRRALRGEDAPMFQRKGNTAQHQIVTWRHAGSLYSRARNIALDQEAKLLALRR
jgi:hypothetical protein